MKHKIKIIAKDFFLNLRDFWIERAYSNDVNVNKWINTVSWSKSENKTYTREYKRAIREMAYLVSESERVEREDLRPIANRIKLFCSTTNIDLAVEERGAMSYRYVN